MPNSLTIGQWAKIVFILQYHFSLNPFQGVKQKSNVNARY